MQPFNMDILSVLLPSLNDETLQTLTEVNGAFDIKVNTFMRENEECKNRLATVYGLQLPTILPITDWISVCRLVDRNGREGLLLSEDPNVIALGLINRLDPSVHNNKAVVHAAKYGNTNALRKLLQDRRVNAGVDDNKVLIEAVTNHRIKVVRELLKSNTVDPGARDNYAIRYAANTKNQEMLDLLASDPRVSPSVLLRGRT